MNNFNLTKYLSKNLLLEDDRESMINHYAHKLAAGEEVSDEFFFDNEATIRDAADSIEKWSNSDADMDEAQMPKKMTRNQLKELIKQSYLEEADFTNAQDDDASAAIASEYDPVYEAKKDKEEEEVEDVTIDDTEDIDIEAPSPASDSEFIASLESLKQQAESLNDPKLTRLLNNTITYYTRNHIVDDESDTMGLAEEENNDMAFIEKLEATLNESNSSKNKRIMKESLEILKMKKLAGLLSEGQYSKALLREMEETSEGIKVEWSKDKLKDIFMTDKYYEKGLLDTSTMMGGKKVKEIVGYFEDENGEEDEETIGYVYSTSGDIDMISQDTLWDAFYNSLTSTKKSYRTGLKEMEKTSEDEVPFTNEVKEFIDKAVADAKADGEFKYLLNAGWFDNELIDELIDLFPDKDYDRASQKVKDYISQSISLREMGEISEDKLPTIKISKDIYYFDKLDRLDTKDNVDEKYHDKANLVFKKGQTVKDDTKYKDSEYKMITSSKSLKKGIDYIS